MKNLRNIWIIFSLLPLILSAQTITVTVANEQGDIGDTILVPLTISDLNGANVRAFQFDIDYRSNYVNFIELEKAGTLTESISTTFNKSEGKIRISGVSANAMSGSGVLLYLKFALTAPGTSNLTFVSDTVNNFFNEGWPLIDLSNGSIKVLSPPNIRFNPGDAVMAVNEIKKFNVYGGTAPYELKLSDPTVASIDNEGNLTALKRGSVIIHAEDANGYKRSSGQIQIRSFEMAVHDTTYYQDNLISIPVYFNNIDQTDVISGEFKLTYNKDILEFKEMLFEGSVLDVDDNVQYYNIPGKLSFSFAFSQAFTSSGKLLIMTFKIADRTGGTTYIDLESGMINETLMVKYLRGVFRITALPNLSISPNITELVNGESAQLSASGGSPPYTWSVSNTDISQIDGSGLLEAIGGGETTVLVQDQLGSQQSKLINIYDTWLGVRDSNADVANYHLTLPLEMGLLPASVDIVAASGNINYQSSAIDSIELITQGTLAETWMAAAHSTEKQTKISMAGTDALDAEGGILTQLHIYFNKSLQPNATIYFDLAEMYLNEGGPKAKLKRGTLRIGTVTPIRQAFKDDPGIQLYPNPVKNVLMLKLTETTTKIRSYCIYDLSGKAMLYGSLNTGQAKINSLNTFGLSPGLYILRLKTSEDLSHDYKFIKQ